MATITEAAMFYANLTTAEQSKLESIESEAANLVRIKFGNHCKPTWIGVDDNGRRKIRLITSEHCPCTIFEIPANEVLDSSPAILYWFMTMTLL